jgi:hypothetical protein
MHGETSTGGRETYCLGIRRGGGRRFGFLTATTGRLHWDGRYGREGTALPTQNLVLLATERGGIWAGWLGEAKRGKVYWEEVLFVLGSESPDHGSLEEHMDGVCISCTNTI